jgi:hypothetical protein
LRRICYDDQGEVAMKDGLHRSVIEADFTAADDPDRSW